LFIFQRPQIRRWGLDFELIIDLSNFYLLARVGDKPTLQALHSECRPKNNRLKDIKNVV
jgi:hypothetical protein